MPANLRQTTKRDLLRAISNLDWVLQKLAEITETYRELHPEVSEPLELTAAMIIMSQEAIAATEKII